MSQYENNKKCHLHGSQHPTPLCGHKGVAGVYSVESMKSGYLKKENVCQRCLAKAKKFRLTGAWAKKLDKPLYHGTSEEDAYKVYYGRGFKDYVYVVDDPRVAEHYAQARTVNVLKYLPKDAYLFSKDFRENPKYAVYEFKSIPDKAELVEDDYSPTGEKGQYIIRAPIIRPVHYRKKGGQEYVSKPLTKDKTERLMLECFGIGMLQGDKPKPKKRR